MNDWKTEIGWQDSVEEATPYVKIHGRDAVELLYRRVEDKTADAVEQARSAMLVQGVWPDTLKLHESENPAGKVVISMTGWKLK